MAKSAPLRRLGSELKRLREETGRTQADVGAAIGRTHTTLVHWEGGKTRPSRTDLAILLAELRATADVRKALEELRIEAGRNRGTAWSEYGIPHWLRPIVNFEEEAVAEASFEPLVIPGLLQTEAYARAIIAGIPASVWGGDVEQLLAGRMRRQVRLSQPTPLKLHAIIGEPALSYPVGGPKVMEEQFRHLLEVAELPHVKLQVLPSAVAHKCGGHCPLFVLSFADANEEPPLAYLETALSGYVIHDVGDVAVLQAHFADLSAAALHPSESGELIARLLNRSTEPGGQ